METRLGTKKESQKNRRCAICPLLVRTPYQNETSFMIVRIRQDLNLRGETPTDFKSVALTTRPRMPSAQRSEPPGLSYQSCVQEIGYIMLYDWAGKREFSKALIIRTQPKKAAPNSPLLSTGLEPMTLALSEPRATNCARRALRKTGFEPAPPKRSVP